MPINQKSLSNHNNNWAHYSIFQIRLSYLKEVDNSWGSYKRLFCAKSSSLAARCFWWLLRSKGWHTWNIWKYKSWLCSPDLKYNATINPGTTRDTLFTKLEKLTNDTTTAFWGSVIHLSAQNINRWLCHRSINKVQIILDRQILIWTNFKSASLRCRHKRIETDFKVMAFCFVLSSCQNTQLRRKYIYQIAGKTVKEGITLVVVGKNLPNSGCLQ